jgi:hypothetical protein
MTTWVFDRTKGELVLKSEYRRPYDGHYVIKDETNVTGPMDGKHYTSKRAYERAVRAAGCVIVGNETQKRGPRHEVISPGHELARRLKGY